MPKIIDPKIRKDAVIRLRLSFSLRNGIKELADKRGIGISDLIRQSLQAEIDKAK